MKTPITTRHWFENGGAEGTRTPYLRIANATLYQMSYSPTKIKTTGLVPGDQKKL
jgi:hypothetical protein